MVKLRDKLKDLNKVKKQSINTTVSATNIVNTVAKNSSKDLNSVVNDLPSRENFLNQKKLSPRTPASTVGLLGFQPDLESVDESILLAQNPSRAQLEQEITDDTLGTIQINESTKSGIQTKTIKVPAKVASQIDEKKIAKLTNEQKQELAQVLSNVEERANKPVFQISGDTKINRVGKEKTVAQSSRIRQSVFDLNTKINQLLGKSKQEVSTIKDKVAQTRGNTTKSGETGAKVTGQKPQTSKPVNLDHPQAEGLL